MDIKVLDANPLYMNETYRLKFKFSNSYPIGEARISMAASIPLTAYHRTARGHFRQACRSTNSYASSRLHEWFHLPGSTWSTGLEPGSERTKRLHEYPEHAHWQYKERAPARGRRVRQKQPLEPEERGVLLS
jgi:hypothetical protein